MESVAGARHCPRKCELVEPDLRRQYLARDPLIVKILAFDVFGTVVDWHGSIQREAEQLISGIDGYAFARAWRAGYQPAMGRVRSGELGWTRIDDLHRLILDDILVEFGVTSLDESQKQHLNRVWHRLNAWPDTIAGMTRLKRSYTLCSLSNGNISLLTNMAKHNGIPWDCLLSAEVFRKYKPDPDTYLGVADLFDIKPEEVMMVAAHHSDLRAARECGLKTAYIERLNEYGAEHPKSLYRDHDNDYHARDLEDLASQLGC